MATEQNFSVPYSDCLLTIGCRLNIRQVSFNWKSFAKNAWKCHLDIDKLSDKHTLSTDLKVHATAKGFFPRLSSALIQLMGGYPQPSAWTVWRAWLKKQLEIYSPVYSALPPKPLGVNPYRFVQLLTSSLEPGALLVCADGTACVVGFQAAVIKPDQRLFHNSGCASMGYELPAAIGAYHATGKSIICLAGDGSIMMNLQELASIGGLGLPIKIFLLNNRGYHSIRQTQNNYFPANPIGCGVESGLSFPDFQDLCKGFGLAYFCTNTESTLRQDLTASLLDTRPLLHEIQLDLEQEFSPKLASKKLADGSMVTSELEDMAPFLGDEEMSRIRAEAMRI